MKRRSLTLWISCGLGFFYSSSIAQEYDNFNKKELRQVVLDRDSTLMDVRGRKAVTIGLVSIEKDTLEQISLRTAALDKDLFSIEESLNTALFELDALKKTTLDLEQQLEKKRLDAEPYRSYISNFKKSAGVR